MKRMEILEALAWHCEQEAARMLGCEPTDVLYCKNSDEVEHWLGLRLSQDFIRVGCDPALLPLMQQALIAYKHTLSLEEQITRRERLDRVRKALQFWQDFQLWLTEKLGENPAPEVRAQYLLTCPGERITAETLGPLAKQFAGQVMEAEAADREWREWKNARNILALYTMKDHKPERCWIEEHPWQSGTPIKL